MIEKKLIARPVTKKIYSELKERIARLKEQPRLSVLIVGNDPASEYYVNSIRKRGQKLGIEVKTLNFSQNISAEILIGKIKELNNDDNIQAIMLQKPLPSQINEYELNSTILPRKDVDAFNPVNLGKLLLGAKGFLPCTPAAVIEMIKFYEIEIQGKNVVILGRSNIVGKPLANLLLRKSDYGNATVTVCHSRTLDLPQITKKADILIAAIGKPDFVQPEMIKKNAVILDVGMNKIVDQDNNSGYTGDVDYEKCFDKASRITPVPGGIGSVTTAMLFKNVVSAAYNFEHNDNFIDENRR